VRILHVVSSMDPKAGGVCQELRSVVPQLDQLGCVNKVVSLDDPRSSFLDTDALDVIACGPSRGPWAYAVNLRQRLEVAMPDCDVVIVHGLWLYHSYAATRHWKSMIFEGTGKRPKLFVMPHGMLDPWFQRHPSRRWKAIRNWWYWKFIECRTIGLADGLLFTCHQELELAREAFRPYSPQTECNVGLGIEGPPEFDEPMNEAFLSKCPAVRDRGYLLFLSRIDPKKGIDLLLQAYANVAGNLDSADSIPALVIAGPTDSEYANKMQQLARELGLAGSSAATATGPCVHFTGMLQGDAKWGAFYGCDAFVLPSHQENFGIVVAEALACGKPVLISDQVNIWREIENHHAGLFCDVNVASVERMLREWLQRGSERGQPTSENARDCFESHFRVHSAAKQLLAAISGSRTVVTGNPQ